MARPGRKPKHKDKILVGVIGLAVLIILLGLFLSSKEGEKKEANNNSNQTNEKTAELKNINPDTGKENKANDNNNNNKTVNSNKDIGGPGVYESSNGYSFDWAADWKVKEQNDNRVEMQLSGGNLAVSFQSNPSGLTMQQYYNGTNAENYFAEAVSEPEKIKVAGKDGFVFKDIMGYSESTIAIIKTEKGFVEVMDLENGHQQDGKFDTLLKKIKIE